MKKLSFGFCLLVLFISAGAQKNLTIEETVMRRADLYPSTLTQLQWIAGSNSYSWVRKTDNDEELVSSANASSKINVLLTLSELNEKIQTTNLTALNTESQFPTIKWITTTKFSYVSKDYTVTYDLRTKFLSAKKLPVYPENAAHHEENPTGTMTAFTVKNNLFIMKDGKVSTVTNDADRGIVNGQSVHREEFGIHKGTFWSPDGKLLAFYRMDETMVTQYPIMEIGNQPATARMIRYPMAGGKTHHVTLGVYSTETGAINYMSTGEPEHEYLTNIAWSPDNKFIYIAELNRDQNHLHLNRYVAATGKFDKTLFEEKDEQWIQPMYTLKFVPGHNDWFVWQSERDGYNAMYLYNIDGTLIRQLTPTKLGEITPMMFPQYASGPVVVTELYGFDPKGNYAYFQCASEGYCNRQICSVDLKKGIASVRRLTSFDGVAFAKFSKDFSQFISEYSNPKTPKIVSVMKSDGKSLGTIHTAPDPLTGYNKCEMRLFTITAADGKTPLWCRMFLPHGFDSTKKYPSLTYVYNGPNVQLVLNSWMGNADLFLYYMAQQGFVVFTVDGRGSDNRGTEFEQVIFRHLGTQEIADQKMGANYLKLQQWIDASRMAVYGWSYGGFMTTSLMTRTPGTYKCGVAGGAVIDWSYYEVMYTERFMDTPQTNPEGYKESNTMNYVQNLEGKLLLIHGTSDDVVVWQHTLLYTKTAVSKGVQTDYYMYPGHLHNVYGKDRVHLLTKVAEYVIANT